MPRPLRIDYDGAWHHVMNRGIDHSAVFFSDSDRIEFGARLADASEQFGVEFHAYCLMDTHYHLLVRSSETQLSESMQRIGSLYTRHVNDRLGREGALFRGRFHSRLIETEKHLLAACRYIHRNPLDIAGVVSATAYRWSSHRAYLGFRACPEFLHTDVVLGSFGHNRDAFADFVASDDQVVTVERLADPDDVARLCDIVELVLVEQGLDSVGHVPAIARSAVLASVADQLDRTMLDTAFAFATPGSRRTALSRARRLVCAHPMLLDAVDRACSVTMPPVTTGV